MPMARPHFLAADTSNVITLATWCFAFLLFYLSKKYIIV